MKRDAKGRFIKGQHWRKAKPFWNKVWLEQEYISKKKSASDIAKKFGIGDTAILYWIHKHGIKSRSTAEQKRIKPTRLCGEKNPMFGRTGKLNPNWKGGISPERQCEYVRSAWKELAKSIFKRDNYKCQDCGVGHKTDNYLVVHHIKTWAEYPDLRFEPTNLLTLCKKCHYKKHSRRK